METDNYNNDNTSIDVLKIDKPHNRIIFGAPGTGKSHMLNKDSKVFIFNSDDNSDRLKLFYSEAKKINSENNPSYKLITLGYDNVDIFYDLFKDYDTHEKLAEQLDLYNKNEKLAVSSISYLHWGRS